MILGYIYGGLITTILFAFILTINNSWNKYKKDKLIKIFMFIFIFWIFVIPFMFICLIKNTTK